MAATQTFQRQKGENEEEKEKEEKKEEEKKEEEEEEEEMSTAKDLAKCVTPDNTGKGWETEQAGLWKS